MYKMPTDQRMVRMLVLIIAILLIVASLIGMRACATRNADSIQEDGVAVVGTIATVRVTATETVRPTEVASSTATSEPTSTPPAPVATASPTPAPKNPTPTLIPPTRDVENGHQHVVAAGETLTSIAELYGVTVAEIQAANNLTGDNIRVDQQLIIPVTGAILITPSAESTHSEIAVSPTSEAVVTPSAAAQVATVSSPSAQVSPPNWAASVFAGDVLINYPRTSSSSDGMILFHHQPGTYPEVNIGRLSNQITTDWNNIQSRLGGNLNRQIDVYLAGTLFGENPSLQGLTQSYQFRTFILVNGAFHQGEADYIIAHELTHIAATHLLGAPSSIMLHEGLALWLPEPEHLVETADYMPRDVICAAAYQTDYFRSASEMHRFGYGAAGFGGHIRTFIHYNLSGCFVGYLIDTYGFANFSQVFSTGDYAAAYGQSLAQLDQEWQAHLATIDVSLDVTRWLDDINQIAQAYEGYISASAGGVHANYAAYLELNRARLAVNRGRLDEAERRLASYWALMNE